MKLCDYADGVREHYCIGRQFDTIYWEYWNECAGDWSAFGTVYVGRETAETKLNELKSKENPVFLNRIVDWKDYLISMEANMGEEFVCSKCNKSDMVEEVGNSFRCKRCGIRCIIESPADESPEKEEEESPTFSLRGKLHA